MIVPSCFEHLLSTYCIPGPGATVYTHSVVPNLILREATTKGNFQDRWTGSGFTFEVSFAALQAEMQERTVG